MILSLPSRWLFRSFVFVFVCVCVCVCVCVLCLCLCFVFCVLCLCISRTVQNSNEEGQKEVTQCQWRPRAVFSLTFHCKKTTQKSFLGIANFIWIVFHKNIDLLSQNI